MAEAGPEPEARQLASGVTPWITICTSPRATIRALVETDPRRHVLLLAALNGVGLPLPLPGAWWLVPLVLGALASILFLYANAAVVRWTGSWLGGRASVAEVRAALAWSAIPRILAVGVGAPIGVLLGDAAAGPPALAWSIFRGLVSLWVVILGIACIAEVHRFSTARALGALLLAGVVLALPLGVLAGLAVALGLVSGALH
jgi:hypothetical protein